MDTPIGLVHVYTGEGKGKTTAALGLALRASGHGLRVHLIQLMKGWPGYGELNALPRLDGVTSRQFGRSEFVDPQQPEEQDREHAQAAMSHAREVLLEGTVDLLILDEVHVAARFGLISVDDLLALLDLRPPQMELVLTGRWADERVMARADLVTEMREVKHPWSQGIPGRKGVEY